MKLKSLFLKKQSFCFFLSYLFIKNYKIIVVCLKEKDAFMENNQGAEGHLFKPKKPRDWFTLVMFILGVALLITGPILIGFNNLDGGIIFSIFGGVFFTISLFSYYIFVKNTKWLSLGIFLFGLGCLVSGIILATIDVQPTLRVVLIIYGVVGILVPFLVVLIKYAFQ